MKTRSLAILMLLSTALASVGCWSNSDRPPLGKVSGIITVDGKPAPGLGVSFQPEGLRPSIGYTDENGRYELTYLRDIKGAAVGTHEVKINRIGETEGTPAKGLPARYNSETELTREVKSGSNEIDFDLESE